MAQPARPILIAGRNGQVAGELAAQLTAAGTPFLALGRDGLDIADPGAIERTVADVGPAVVINAAAYTAVDKAEDEPEVARAINALGAGRLAAAAQQAGAPIIHVSTDYVFDGSKNGAYTETDPANPLGVYGATKLEGELLVAAANPRHVIVRTAWVYSPHGSNFVKTMLRLAASRDEIGVVADQRGSPTSAADLATALLAIASRVRGVAANDGDAYGTFNAAGSGTTTWAGFANAIMAGAAERGAPAARIKPITTADYPTRARRPANSVLDCSKLARVHGIGIGGWEPALARCLDILIGPALR